MKVLVFGGTHFVGRHVVQALIEREHEVTLFNRGISDPTAFPTVERLCGDRRGDYSALRGREWDAVFDPSAFLPDIVRATCHALGDRAGHYVFVSTTAVYDVVESKGPYTEHSPVTPLADPDTKDIHFAGDYGALKAACERLLRDQFGERAVSVRPGLIAGPGDLTDRVTYWPRRVAQGGQILAPGPPSRQLQILDVRDLARWVVSLMERRVTGTYNAAGPSTTLGELIGACERVVRAPAHVEWVDDAFLVMQGVRQWTELPLWMSYPQRRRIEAVRNDEAVREGLRLRPLESTVSDLYAWDRTRPRPLHRGPVGTRYVVEPILPERERDLLHAWQAHGRP